MSACYVHVHVCDTMCVWRVQLRIVSKSSFFEQNLVPSSTLQAEECFRQPERITAYFQIWSKTDPERAASTFKMWHARDKEATEAAFAPSSPIMAKHGTQRVVTQSVSAS